MTEDILKRIIESYGVDDLCDILGLTSEMLVDKFRDAVYDNLDSFDVFTDLDWVNVDEGDTEEY